MLESRPLVDIYIPERLLNLRDRAPLCGVPDLEIPRLAVVLDHIIPLSRMGHREGSQTHSRAVLGGLAKGLAAAPDRMRTTKPENVFQAIFSGRSCYLSPAAIVRWRE